jgi:hypothetical protein
MKRIASVLPVVVLVVLGAFLLGAGSGTSSSGLRGKAVFDPGSPVCKVGSSCTRPAAHALLRFWRHGEVIAHTRTDAKGHFRIALKAHMYRVTTKGLGLVKPAHVTVATDRYRRITFRIDTGIR